MSDQDEAWLGWRDDRLVAIELPGFHTEGFQEWKKPYHRVMITNETKATDLWRETRKREAS